jgi:PAS domain S-box-containing protein
MMSLFAYRSLELRKQLALLILMLFVPVLLLLLFMGYRDYKHTEERIQSDANRLIRLFIEGQSDIVNQTRQLLNIISHVQAVQGLDIPQCNAFLEDIYRENPQYSTIVVANSQGIIECCAIPLKQPIDIKDRSWFRRVSQEKDFVIDNFLISRSANKASLPFAYPILDKNNRFVAAVGAAYDLDRYNKIFNKIAMPPGTVIFVADRNQSVLHASPPQGECIGKALSECRGFAIPDLEKGNFTIEDSDGVKRLYWFERIFAGEESNQVTILVGISEQTIFSGARQMLAINLTLLVGLASFCFALAWFFGKKRILDPVSLLVQRTRQVQGGDLSLSNAWESMPGELGTLAKEFDLMLAKLSQREVERDEALTAMRREIRRHEQTVATLREREEHLRILFEQAADAIYVANLDGALVKVNQQACRATGYTEEELRRLNVTEVDIRIPSSEVFQRIVEGPSHGNPITIETTHRRKDGSTFPAEVRIALIQTQEGSRVLGIARDITERKRAEMSLRNKESTLRGILDATRESIFQFSRDGVILMANETAAKRLGTRVEEIIGQHYSRFMTPQLAQSRQGPLTEAMESGMPMGYEDERSGILFDHTFYPVFDTDGLVTSIVAFSRDITESRRASKELEAALVKYRTLFECFPLGITVSDPEGNFLESNREAERLLGLPAEDQRTLGIDAPEWKIVRPDGTPMPAYEFASVRALREQRLIENVEMGIIQSAGETTWISVTAVPLPLPGYGVVITYSDISARRQMEQSLKEREEIFSSIVSQALDAIGLVDTGGRFVEFNTTAHEGLGYTREEFSALTVADIQADHSPEIIHHHMELVRAQGGLVVETKHRHRSGEIRDVRVSIKLLRIRDQEFFASVWTDITERKRAEEDLRFHKAILEETGHIAKVGGWHFDPATGNGFWTEEVARIHDLDPSLPTSMELGLQYYAGESRTKIESAVKDAVERGIPYDLELELISAKGVRKWVRTIGHPTLEGGRVVAVQGSFQDISDHRRAEDALRHSLEEKVALLKEVHHRVKNNLQIVASLLSLQAGCSDNEQVVSVLEDTRNRVRSMALLHEALYHTGSLARIDFTVYLKDLCGQLLSYSPAAGRVHMEYRIDTIGLPLEQAVPCGLIVSELVSNALKYAFSGERAGKVIVRLKHAEGKRLVMSVQDDGIGLPPGFDPEGGGTLGLQLVAGLARQLGGHLETESSKGPGATFRIVFPLPKDTKLGEEL